MRTICMPDNQHQQQDLAIEAWFAQVAPHPAINAEVDERGKGPYLFRLHGPPVQAGNDGDGEKEGQGQVLAMQHGGQGEHRSAKERGQRSQTECQG